MNFYKERFSEIRKNKKLKLKDMAVFIGRTYDALAKWERGDRTPSESDVRMLAKIMEIPITEISDLVDEQFYPDEMHNKAYNINKSLLVDKNLKEINHIIENYSDLPKAKINSIIQLEKHVNELLIKERLSDKNLAEYKHILKKIPILIYVKNINLKYKYVNSAFSNLSGYSPEKIIGFSSSDIFGFQEIKDIIKYEQESISLKENIYDKEINIPGTNNKRTGRLNIVLSLNQNNDILSIICTIEDITSYKTILDRLNILDNALNQIDDFIYIKTYNPLKYIYRSKGIEKITGRSRFEFYDNKISLFDLIHPEDKKKYEMESKAEKAEHKIQRYRILHKSGRYLWLEENINKHFYKHLNAWIYFGIIKDITDKVKIEELTALLKINSDYMPLGIVIRDADDSKYLYFNKAFEKIIGYSRKTLIENEYPEFFTKNILHPDDREAYTNSKLNKHTKSFKHRIITQNKKINLIKIVKKPVVFRGKNCTIYTFRLLKYIGDYLE